MSTANVLRPAGRSRLGRLLALLSATAVAASLLSAPSSPAVATAGPARAPVPGTMAGLTPAADAEPVAVTLVTGDTVYWQDTGDGNPRLEVKPAPRDHLVEFEQFGTQQDFYVIPTDIAKQVVAGAVDKELFNIPGLIRQGLDDATTDQLPVIVTFDRDRSTQQLTRDADALPATTRPTALKGVNGAGVKLNRSNARAFRQAVLDNPGRDRTPRAAGTRGLDSAVKQILLDRLLEVDLAESVPQIGAPRAWDAGYTGEGVTVAVLDTGVDATHPDLAGKIIATKNFTAQPDATDTHGHGTHVASTIAGTGAASDGARTGVAPGADLLIGKVCFVNDAGDGVCPTSSVMAGMQWATAQGADIVNMSLGGQPTDGTDPLSQLLNQLSADTDTLFVTSAGNRGPRPQTVGAPGAADAALAVGAVTKTDVVVRFSSRGPRAGDHAVKPEITAPGVGIVAARAAGTSAGRPVDDHYTSLSGTSMASPHVAGAAALLAQARPDLNWAELKDTLVSTTSDIGRQWYEQGVGRVSVPDAVNSPVHATGTVNLGHVTDRAAQNITYTNHGDADITLDLAASITNRDGEPIDVATLSTDRLVVPTGGRATATITVDVAGIPERDNLIGGGVVTATGDGVTLRTGIGFGPIRHKLTIELLDSKGNRVGTPSAPDTGVSLDHDSYDSDHPVGRLDYALFTNGGVGTVHVPSGIYTLTTRVDENDPATGRRLRGSLLVEVELVVESDTTITLDARDAIPVEMPTVPREVDRRNQAVSLLHQRTNIHPGFVTTSRTPAAHRPMYVTPTPPGELGFVKLWVHWVLAEPQPVHGLPWNPELCTLPQWDLPFWCYSEAPAYVYNLPFLYDNGIPDSLHETITRQDLIEIPSRFHADPLNDVYISHTFEALPPVAFVGAGQEHRMWIQPGEVTEYILADNRFTWTRGFFVNHRTEGATPGVAGVLSSDRFPTAEAGSIRAEERWGEVAFRRMGTADFREEFLSNPMGMERFAAASRGGTDGNQFIPGYHIMDNSRGHFTTRRESLPPLSSWRMWNRDTGVELEGVEFNPISLPGVPLYSLAPESTTYVLELRDQYPDEAGALFRTGPITTTWTFTSHPANTQVPSGYVCPHPSGGQGPRDCQIQPLIQLEYDLDLDLHNRISARRGAHVFTITAGQHSKAIDRAPVTSMSVQASFDDGETWHDARVVGKPKNTWDTGGFLQSTEPYQQFRVVLKLPQLKQTNGFVALRVRATDANGGTVDQMIHRAYILK